METEAHFPPLESIDPAELLRRARLRPTRQRRALARLLFAGGKRHVTAEALFAEAQNANMQVSLATVYNTLHQFTEAGLLREVVVNSACTYFDTNVSEHHHFFHEDQGVLTDISGAEVDIRAIPAAPEGMKISRVDVIIRLSGRN